MERHAAPVWVVEIDGYAPGKLPELAMRARIADRINGEGDMGSRGIDPIVRRRGGRHAGLCQDTKREDRADDVRAPDNIVACGHLLLTILICMNIRGGRPVRFLSLTSRTR